MNWAGLQTVLAAQVATIAGCPAYWRDVTAQWEAWPRVFLSVVSVRKLGQDETRTRYVQVDDVLLPRVYGGRVLTVQIQVESRDQNLAASAGAIGEQTRTRLGRLTVLDALRAVDIGVSTTTDVRVVNRTDDKARVVSYAVFEAVLVTHVSDEEDDSADFGYIETAEIVQTIDPVQDAETKTYLVGPQDEPPAPEEDYMANGTYSPTITVTGDGAASLPGALGWTRIGSTTTPAAGDTVIVFGRLTLTGMSDGDVVGIPLPFIAAFAASHGGPIVPIDTDMTGYSRLSSTAALEVVLGVTSDDTGGASFSQTYRTANAVDP